MRQAARIAAAIDVLEAIDRTDSGADRLVTDYFRRRRYAGSKDRAAVSDLIYATIRRQQHLDWWLSRLDAAPEPRSRLLADMMLSGAMIPDRVSDLFDASEHGPAALSAAEQHLLEQLAGEQLEHPDMSLAVRGECPEWVASRLQAVFGDAAGACLAALGREAGLDLRLNPLKTEDRRGMRRKLRRFGLETELTPHSPYGLRAHRRRRIDNFMPFRNGEIEVQDEGAQLASLLVGAEPGMQVADFCAGAGGKTLLLGAMMENRGRVMALDVAADRLDRAAIRISRAGLHNVERRVLAPEKDRYLKRWAGRFDRVLVDAPCTGIGAWRRDPEARWRCAEDDLDRMIALQDRLLAQAASLTQPGGRLIYVTCSLLAEENELRIAHLLRTREDFRILPVAGVWQEAIAARGGGPCPESGETLLLTPHEHGTDGFYVAVMQRFNDS